MSNEEYLIPIVAIGGTAIVFVVWIVVDGITKIITSRHDTSLKHQMVGAGMSASEIERVILCGRGDAEEQPAAHAISKPPVMKGAVGG